MNEPLIQAVKVHKNYQIDRLEIPVLKGIDAEFRSGEITAIVGPSGVGKTTLLNILGALDRPTSGEVFLQGKAYSKMNEAEFARFRNSTIGFVFQFHHLLREFTAWENVMIPQLIAGKDFSSAKKEGEYWLEKMGLGDRLEHKPSELSGGEQGRVAVARALVKRPQLVLADEPAGNLDQKSGELLTNILWDLCRKEGHGFIIVTHNLELARKADRVIEMKDGKIILNTEY
jgi:lipoprotein-releasing system ATP-binding protein